MRAIQLSQSDNRPLSLFKGTLGVALLAAELEDPDYAACPLGRDWLCLTEKQISVSGWLWPNTNGPSFFGASIKTPGDPEKPLKLDSMSELEAARRLAFLMTKAAGNAA
jgi:hypothetical protein